MSFCKFAIALGLVGCLVIAGASAKDILFPKMTPEKGTFDEPFGKLGTKTKTSPQGSFDSPLRPLTVALAAEASFIARTIDVDVQHLTSILHKAYAHKGSCFIEIYQNCKIFNDAVFDYATDRAVKADNVLYLEHGKPMIFGKNRTKGIRLNGLAPEIVEIGKDCGIDDLLIHDEKAENPTLAYLLSRFIYPQFPECVGVFRQVTRPTYEDQLQEHIDAQVKAKGKGDLEKLFKSDDLWTVE